MKKFEQLPEEVQEQVKEILKAYNSTSVTFENGKYHFGGYSLKATYASDYEVVGEYTADDFFTKEERIIVINSMTIKNFFISHFLLLLNFSQNEREISLYFVLLYHTR